MMKSGKQIAEINFRLFEDWISERRKFGDWRKYIRLDQLNRSEIAKECSFSKSALRQNPRIKGLLEETEIRLRSEGVLEGGNPSKERQADKSRSNQAAAKKQDRIKKLEEENAILKSEIEELKMKLKSERVFNDHLFETGRCLSK